MVFEKFAVHVWSPYAFNTLLRTLSMCDDHWWQKWWHFRSLTYFCPPNISGLAGWYYIKLLRLKVRVNPFWPDVCVFHNLYNSTRSIWGFRRFSSRLDFWFSKISQFRLKASFLSNFYQFWHISWCPYSLGYFYRLLIRQKTTKLIETQVQFHSNTRILFMCSLVEYHI